jgi:hypothetical protein
MPMLFNPSDLSEQEAAYFNRAVGHAYKGQQAWLSGTRNREAAAENSDINAVCVLTRRRGYDVSFQDVHAHVHGRAISLCNNHRSYTYGGYAFPAYPMNYYSSGYNGRSYFDTTDVLLGAAFGVLLFDAMEMNYQQQEIYSLEQQNYFNDFNNGGAADIIQTNDYVVDDGTGSGGAWGNESVGDSFSGDQGSDGGWGGDTTGNDDFGGSNTDNSGGGWGGDTGGADTSDADGGDDNF